jgi:hypothetical protein
LSIVNTANATPLFLFDVANSKIGVNTTVANLAANTAFTISGNAFAYNLGLSNNITVGGDANITANVYADNMSANSNVTTANFTATNNANAVNISASGNINSFNNISAGGNVFTPILSVAGNTTTANISVSGNANINNLTVTNFSTTGNTTGSNLSLTGNLSANNVTSNSQIATGNITGGNIISNAAINGVDLSLTGQAVLPSITGNTNGNVTIVANGTGVINLDNLSVNNTTISSVSAGNLVTIGGTDAVVIPSGNIAQRPSSPPAGAVRLNTGLDELEFYDGAAWVAVGGGGGGSPGTITDQQITPDGSSTDYTLNQSATNNNVLVFLNGVLQYPGTSYSVSGTTISFAAAPQTGDIIDIRFVAYTATVSSLANPSGTAFVETLANSTIQIGTNSTVAVTVTSAGVLQITGQSLQLPVYTVSQAAAISSPAAGQVILVSNGNSGSPCLAVYDGATWKRIALGATISAT